MVLPRLKVILLIVTIILSAKVEERAAQWKNVNPIDDFSYRPAFRMMRDTFLNLVGQSGNDKGMFEQNLKRGVSQWLGLGPLRLLKKFI